MKFRKEFDSLGKISVPADKYWGASTQRSNKHFDIGDFLVRPIVIKSIAMIKKAAAIVHSKNKDIDWKSFCYEQFYADWAECSPKEIAKLQTFAFFKFYLTKFQGEVVFP